MNYTRINHIQFVKPSLRPIAEMIISEGFDLFPTCDNRCFAIASQGIILGLLDFTLETKSIFYPFRQCSDVSFFSDEDFEHLYKVIRSAIANEPTLNCDRLIAKSSKTSIEVLTSESVR